jgi:transposase
VSREPTTNTTLALAVWPSANRRCPQYLAASRGKHPIQPELVALFELEADVEHAQRRHLCERVERVCDRAWTCELARRDLVPAIWLPDPLVRAERERARWRLHLVRHRSSLKQRVHAVLLTHGKPCPVSDLFGVRGRRLLANLGLPEPWQATIEASLRLIDELEREISECERELRRLGADHRYVPLLCTVPGISWVLAYTIAAELGDINRFPTPRKLAGYTGLCPRVYQSGERDLRGPLAKQGPRYLRWALVEAATHACTNPIYRERYQQTKARIGKQRGAKVAQVDLARRLSEAIWHMLTREQPFTPKGATDPPAA